MDSGMYSIVLLVLMFALLYFFMIRPENKRKKQAQAMRDSLTVGAKAMPKPRCVCCVQ